LEAKIYPLEAKGGFLSQKESFRFSLSSYCKNARATVSVLAPRGTAQIARSADSH
jgi:hypothetical protein